MSKKLNWKIDDNGTYFLFAKLILLNIKWEVGLHEKGSNLPTGYRVEFKGWKNVKLKKLYSNIEDAKLAAEAALQTLIQQINKRYKNED